MRPTHKLDSQDIELDELLRAALFRIFLSILTVRQLQCTAIYAASTHQNNSIVPREIQRTMAVRECV